jgi:serine/threonine-protein kinase
VARALDRKELVRMSEGKGADDLHVFDDLLKNKSSSGSGFLEDEADGSPVPPPPISTPQGALIARSSVAAVPAWPASSPMSATHPAAATNMTPGLLARSVAGPPSYGTAPSTATPVNTPVGGPPLSVPMLAGTVLSAPPPPVPLTFTASSPARFEATATALSASPEPAPRFEDERAVESASATTSAQDVWLDDDDEEETGVHREFSLEDNWDIPSPNPFLSPLAPAEKGGPASLLPPTQPAGRGAFASSPGIAFGATTAAFSSGVPSAPRSSMPASSGVVAPMPVLAVQGISGPPPAPPEPPPSARAMSVMSRPIAPGHQTLLGGTVAAPPPPAPVASHALPVVPSSFPTMPVGRPVPSTTPPFALAGSLPPPLLGLGAEVASARRARTIRTVAVGAGALVAVLAIVFVTRDKFGSAATPAAIQQAMAGIRASSMQEGIRLVVDGRERGLLPQDIRDLSPGEHSIVFDGGDRYASQKSTITLAANEVRELGPVSLRVTRGTATFDVRSPTTSLSLVATDERRALTDWSHPVDVDNSKSWMLEAARSGYKTVRFPILFDNQAAKTFVVSVDDPVDGAVAAAPQPAADTDSTLPVAVRRARRGGAIAARTPKGVGGVPVPAADTGPAEPATGGGTCTLNINSIPPTRIALDGRPMGLTPKIGVSVPSGTHTVMFVGETSKKTSTTTCRPGEQKTVAVRLTE